METAARSKALAEELGIPRIVAVANKVRGPQDAQAMRDFFARAGLPLVGLIPEDEMLLEADRAGRSPLDHDAHSPAVLEITRLTDALTANPNPKIIHAARA
jgi:CO dehydrogenase maturation factor